MKNKQTPQTRPGRQSEIKMARRRLEVRQPSAVLEILRRKINQEIEIGMRQLRRGEKIPGSEVFRELRERSGKKQTGK
jgi:hypothetical protein